MRTNNRIAAKAPRINANQVLLRHAMSVAMTRKGRDCDRANTLREYEPRSAFGLCEYALYHRSVFPAISRALIKKNRNFVTMRTLFIGAPICCVTAMWREPDFRPAIRYLFTTVPSCAQAISDERNTVVSIDYIGCRAAALIDVFRAAGHPERVRLQIPPRCRIVVAHPVLVQAAFDLEPLAGKAQADRCAGRDSGRRRRAGRRSPGP